MSTTVDTKFYEKKKQTSFYIAVGFFLLVILWTVALHLYTQKIESANEILKEEISAKQQHIQDIQSKEDVKLYGIYQKHQVLLERFSDRSQIPLLVSHLKKNFAKYGVEAKGFQYSDWVATINLSTQKNDSKQAYQKVYTFLEEYAKDEKARFEISPIDSFAGFDRINYVVTFNLK